MNLGGSVLCCESRTKFSAQKSCCEQDSRYIAEFLDRLHVPRRCTPCVVFVILVQFLFASNLRMCLCVRFLWMSVIVFFVFLGGCRVVQCVAHVRRIMSVLAFVPTTRQTLGYSPQYRRFGRIFQGRLCTSYRLQG